MALIHFTGHKIVMILEKTVIFDIFLDFHCEEMLKYSEWQVLILATAVVLRTTSPCESGTNDLNFKHLAIKSQVYSGIQENLCEPFSWADLFLDAISISTFRHVTVSSTF